MVTRSLGKTLRPLSSTFRAKVRALYRARATSASFDRQLLEHCLFEVQNDLEHRQHDHPMVAILNAVRNVLLNDLGINEGEQMNRLRSRDGRAPFRWPHVERVATIMREKRRARPQHGFATGISAPRAEESFA